MGERLGQIRAMIAVVGEAPVDLVAEDGVLRPLLGGAEPPTLAEVLNFVN
jgi:hypothetical protein